MPQSRKHRGVWGTPPALSARVSRHCEEQSDEAIQNPARDSGLLPPSPRLRRTRRFARNDDFAWFRILAARFRPSCCNSFAPLGIEGAGNAGCALHPRSRVPKVAQLAHTSIQGSGNTPTSPAQWLYGLLRALPGERLFCHRHLAEHFPQGLAPASRRQDHTTSPYALVHSSALARLNKSVHRSPAQRVVTIAKRPSCGPGWRN